MPLLAEQKPEAAATIVFRLIQSGEGISFAAAGARLATLRSTETKGQEALAEQSAYLAGNWARALPEEAARWVETLPPGPVLNGTVGTVARTWHQYDPEAARAWAESLADEGARKAAVEALGP